MDKVKVALAALGWCLSAEGLSKCEDGCKEKGWAVTSKTIINVALNLDLRSIATQSVPGDIARSADKKVSGPKIFQIQKVKNVAVPSTKQHNPSPSKRFLRLQLTDGKVNLSAVEIEGPIDKLGPATPPGTKFKLTGHISVVNGFLLLTKSSTEVLGGQVETLLNKWSMNKVVPDNLSRSKAGTATGPPPFVAFRESSQSSVSKKTATVSKGKELNQLSKSKDQPEKEQDKSTRIQLEKPLEKPQRKPDRKPEAAPASRRTNEPYSRYPERDGMRGGGFSTSHLEQTGEKQAVPSHVDQSSGVRGTRQGHRQRGAPRDDDQDYQPQSRPRTDYQLADFFGQKLNLGQTPSRDDPYIQPDVGTERLKTDDQIVTFPERKDTSFRRHHTTETRTGHKTSYSSKSKAQQDYPQHTSGDKRESYKRTGGFGTRQDTQTSEKQAVPSDIDQSSGVRGKRQGHRQRGAPRDDDQDYQPQSRPRTDYQLADFIGQTLNIGKTPSRDDQYIQTDIGTERLKIDEQTIKFPERKNTSVQKHHTTGTRTGHETSYSSKSKYQQQNHPQHSGEDIKEGYKRTDGEQRQPRRDEKCATIEQSYSVHDNRGKGPPKQGDRHRQNNRAKKEYSSEKGTGQYVSRGQSTFNMEHKKPSQANSDRRPDRGVEDQLVENYYQNSPGTYKKNEAPLQVRGAMNDDVKQNSAKDDESNHWDWIGSSSLAVPYSARQQ